MAQGKPNSCVCCDHPQRSAIDRAIVAGDSLRDIGTMFGTSKNAVQRHKNGCMKQTLSQTTDSAPTPEPLEYKTATEVARGEDLQKWSKGILGKAVSYMNQAEAAGDLRTACSAIREARGCIELLGRFQGELGPNSQVNVQVNNIPSLTTSPEYPILMRVLDRHPEIRDELNQALQEAGL